MTYAVNRTTMYPYGMCLEEEVEEGNYPIASGGVPNTDNSKIEFSGSNGANLLHLFSIEVQGLVSDRVRRIYILSKGSYVYSRGTSSGVTSKNNAKKLTTSLIVYNVTVSFPVYLNVVFLLRVTPSPIS